MDTDTEKLCFEEIDHLVLDAGKKMNLQALANNWNAPFADGEAVLKKWLDKYAGDQKIMKEYLIRGTDANGNVLITVIAEKNLDKVEKKCPGCRKTLYSIEVSSANGRSLNVTEASVNKFISLKLKSERRNIKVKQLPVTIKKEPEPKKKPINSLFGASTSKPKQNTETAPKVKEEKISPKKESPQKKQNKPAQQGKSSIATFFSAKPASNAKASTSIAQATSDIQKIQIKEESSALAENKDATVKVDANKATKSAQEEENATISSSSEKKGSKKRAHPKTSGSDEKVSSPELSDKPSNKKAKMAKIPARSRLLQICDSSDEEEPTKETIPVKKEKENKTPSPKKSEEKNTNGANSGKRRIKVKKTVVRNYEDEEGFINTVRETIEISESDDEMEVKKEEPVKKPNGTSNTSSSSTSTAANKKKISPPANAKKQGSILSFFGKK